MKVIPMFRYLYPALARPVDTNASAVVAMEILLSQQKFTLFQY